jgi:exoribonuclease R
MELINKNIKVIINDRNYTSWKFLDIEDKNRELDVELYPILKRINPINLKLFSRDVINIDSRENILIKNSFVRTSTTIAGVLILEGNKTFGRTSNKKRLFYKCIPDDKRQPIFIIPYEMRIGFAKVYTNKFITFKFDNWDDKHPSGIITETLGDVDNLEVFYEYQLYCKSIHESITDFTNRTRAILNKKTQDEYIEQIFKNKNFNIEDRRDVYTFTIDPPNSVDFDDGFSIEKLEDGCNKVTIYIANVFFWIETLGLWNSFSRRVATIYLPDRRRPMLPTILSDTLCSLQQNQFRFALAMDFIINNDGKILGEPTYKNVLISVNKNYSYETQKMILNDKYYQQLFDLTTKMSKHIKNSYDLVSFWMVKMNKTTGYFMARNGFGIFRSAVFINSQLRIDENIDIGLNEDTIRVIQNWNNTLGQYILFKEGVNLEHEVMSTQSYIHITSPIRRLVDLLNHMLLFKHLSIVNNMSNDADSFIEKWANEMEYINTAMRSIRKVQTDCELMNRCFNTPDIMNIEHTGVLFDKIVRNDGRINYMVYLEDLKLLSRISTSIDLTNYSIARFKLFLFENEDKTKKKIRLHILS